MEIQYLYSNEGNVLDGPLLLKPNIFNDKRGFFFESWNQNIFNKSIGKEVKFVQDNHSLSKKGTVRGMHFQTNPYQQSKLVRCMSGSIFDVIVDIRKISKTFGQWSGVQMKSSNHYQLWVPAGFAHGFLALTEDTEVLYKVDQFRYQKHEYILNWNDQSIGIKWPFMNEPYNLSDKDKNAPTLDEINNNDLL